MKNTGAQLQDFLDKMLNSTAYQRGNATEYSPNNVTFNSASPLAGKRIAFLGSLVTYGFAAKGKSFVDYLQARDGVQVTKSAISGTTLAGLETGGYLDRLEHDFSANSHYDLFVCQLSTNDNRHGKVLGNITPSDQWDNFDCSTTLGAIEEICHYVRAHFDCPLTFYTCLQDDPAGQYANLIAQLKKLQAKWDFTIIDLFHNQGLLASTAAHPNAMFDDVHPTQEGYLKIWLPVFERELTAILAS
ncbi:SGNH/GDSL hydrolase family protein [Limosilactobacillus sp.]|uniref:SGNH/GDSL hydrolase family protein n=1 Tax=Limosilactobacillus sp. TaxID=2773925 RepID=UPI002ADC4C96|nr:GDSL-type esterase/lipase family protein [Lactobacillaceae bacterium]